MNQHKPKISVIMPVYNDERFVSAAMGSILRQTFGDFEVIVVDDGSTDATTEIIKGFADSRIRIIRQENQGPAVARTNGVLAAEGEYIAFMDSDDISEPTRLELQNTFLDNARDIAMVGCATRIISETGRILFNQSAPTGPDIINRRLGEDLFCFYGAEVMVRRQAAVEAGLFRGEIVQREDTDFFLRMNEKFRMDNVPEFLYRYRMNTRSLGFTRWKEQKHFGELVRELAEQRKKTGADSLQRGEALNDRGETGSESPQKRSLGSVLAWLCLEEAQLATENGEKARAVYYALRATYHQPFNRNIHRGARRLVGNCLIGKKC